jgi:hypothetical protein
MRIPREHFDHIRRFEPTNRFKGVPVRNDAAAIDRVPQKKLKVGDLVNVNISKIVCDEVNHPIGFKAYIPDIQQYTNIPQKKVPFIPRSLVPLVRFREITGIIERGGNFSTIAKVEQDMTGRGNFILSLLLSQTETVPQIPQKPQIETNLKAPHMSQTEIDLQNLNAGNYVPVKLLSVEFEESEKGKPYFNALFTFDFHGEKAAAALHFDDRRFSRGDLIRLADSHKVVPIRARPFKGGKLDLESDGMNADWEFNLQKVFYEAKELRRAAEAYRHTKNFHYHK